MWKFFKLDFYTQKRKVMKDYTYSVTYTTIIVSCLRTISSASSLEFIFVPRILTQLTNLVKLQSVRVAAAA